MDRSFLSAAPVIDISRRFVCVRLATYEDPIEAKFTQKLVRTGSGQLENTAFCLFAPDGATKLVRAGRGTRGVFAGPDEMAAEMTRIAGRYPGKTDAGRPPLPTVTTPKLAVAVAAADNLPLVLIVAKDEATRQAAAEVIADLAWGREFIGRFTYATTATVDDAVVTDIPAGDAVVVVQPEKFGRSAAVLARCPLTVSSAELAAALRAGAEAFARADKSFQSHVRDGHRLGVYYEPPVPVTDPMEKAARERGRQKKQ